MDEWVDHWIEHMENLGRIDKSDVSTKLPVYLTTQIQKRWIDLKVSLQMLLREATSLANEWKDVNRKYNDRRSFPTFSWLLQMTGLDWHKYIVSEDNDINVSNQPNRWPSLQASSHDLVHLRPELTSNSDWVMANVYYGRSLSLMRLLQRIQKEFPDEFSLKQAELLEDFLGHLNTILKEQRGVACSFSDHLEQLRISAAASSLAFSSNAVDADGDREPFILSKQTLMDDCPFVVSDHTMEYCMWQQEHLFDSLYIISRESTWLLRKLKDSRFASPSFIKESDKILEIIVPFISKFKKTKESLNQYLLDKCFPFVEEGKMMQLIQENRAISDQFGNHIKVFQAKGVGKGSVIKNILDCLEYACKISMDDYGEKNILSSLDAKFTKAVQETIELVDELTTNLNSIRLSTLTGGSPLGNITLWRILFESSLVDFRLDLIIKRHGEAVRLGFKLLGEYNSPTVSCHVQTHLNQLHAKISLLLSDGNKVLLDFVAMHRT
ncbi:hypothetical protein MKW94_022609, partial [Papaver nudicaule]|nr:hypothetical protein [Papaver nudicaule]